MSSSLHYSGHLYLRQRLVLSILSGKAIKIDKIRPGDKNPGLCGALSESSELNVILRKLRADYEVSLLRLIEKVTNGTVIEISLTGTRPLSSNFSVTEKKDRYCNPCQTWNHCWRCGHARMSYISVNRIFLGASHHARSIFKKAVGSDSEGHYL